MNKHYAILSLNARRKCNLEFRKMDSSAHTVLLIATVDSLVQTQGSKSNVCKLRGSRISVGGTVTGLQTGGPKTGVSITGRCQKFLFSPARSV